MKMLEINQLQPVKQVSSFCILHSAFEII